jgi:hypothetical protein
MKIESAEGRKKESGTNIVDSKGYNCEMKS